jgi:hypothetical protein
LRSTTTKRLDRADVDADRGELDIVGGPRNLVDRGVSGVDVQVLEFEVVHREAKRPQARLLA